MNRRQLLAGAGASAGLAGVGAAAVDVADHPLWERGLRHIGWAASPDTHSPPSGAEQHSGTLRSDHVPFAPRWTVSIPPGRQALQGIIFCLHGKGGDHRMAFDAVAVPDAAALVGLRVAVAAVDGGPDSYWHRRADGSDALAMLLDEFVPLVRTMVGAHPQAVMGWSMGGYGALLAAERATASFVAVAPASPALRLRPGDTAPGAFDGPADFFANDVWTGLGRLRSLTVAVACGTGDPFYRTTQDLVAQLGGRQPAYFGAGFHDAAYWRSAAPHQLRAFLPVLA